MVQEEGLQLNFGKASKTLIYKSPDSKWEPQRPTRNNDTRLLRDRNPIQTSAQRPSASNLPFFCGWRQSQPSCNDQQHVSCSLQQQFRAVRTCTHAVIRGTQCCTSTPWFTCKPVPRAWQCLQQSH